MQGKYRISVLLISLVRNSPTLELRWDAWQLTECTKRMLIIFVVHNEEILFLDCLILKRNVLRPFETYVGNYLPVGVVHHSCEFHRLPIWNRVSFHILESSGKARLLWKSITINQSLNIDNMRTKPDINCTNTVPNPSSLLSYNIPSYFFFNFHGTVLRFYVFKPNQQDATLHNFIYYYKCSTCFRRFLCPSSGAQNCIHSMVYMSSFYCFLPLAHASLVSWWWAEEPPETCRAFIVINTIV